MSPRVDVVAPFFRQGEIAKAFFDGIRVNRELVNNVFIVNDEPWGDNEAASVLADAHGLGAAPVLLDHEHQGYGVARSLNQGVAAAGTDFVLLLGFDMMMGPGFLERRLREAEAGVLSCGSVRTVIQGGGGAVRPMMIPKLAEQLRSWRRQWRCVVGHYLVDRASWLGVGGCDEGYVGAYGCEDWDLGARWMMAYGDDAVRFSGEDCVFHRDSPRTGKFHGIENQARFLQTLRRLYGTGHLTLYANALPVPWRNLGSVLVAQPGQTLGELTKLPTDLFLPAQEVGAWAGTGWKRVETVTATDPGKAKEHALGVRGVLGEGGEAWFRCGRRVLEVEDVLGIVFGSVSGWQEFETGGGGYVCS